MSWGNRIPRICTWARFRDRATGRQFAVANVHLDHESQRSRERSVELIIHRLVAIARDLPTLLLGDFNAAESNPAVMAARDAAFVDTYRIHHPRDGFVGTFGGFAGDSTGAKIDYVFARGPWIVDDADILRRRAGSQDPSDHFPVVARLRLE
jgi:endonuclease/exonuclease/phosphatase family metal-dependent hydrolase